MHKLLSFFKSLEDYWISIRAQWLSCDIEQEPLTDSYTRVALDSLRHLTSLWQDNYEIPNNVKQSVQKAIAFSIALGRIIPKGRHEGFLHAMESICFFSSDRGDLYLGGIFHPIREGEPMSVYFGLGRTSHEAKLNALQTRYSIVN